MSLNWLPNALTLSRCFFAAAILYGAWKVSLVSAELQTAESTRFETLAGLEQLWHQFILLAFLAGAFTDFSDGWLARALKAESRFGIWLDPIADKLLVGAALICLVWLIGGLSILLPAAIIIFRDLFMTLFRLTERGKRVVHVSQLAKWKTMFEMIAIAGFFVTFALTSRSDPARTESSSEIGPLYVFLGAGLVVMLWIAAFFSVLTALGYLRTAFKPS